MSEEKVALDFKVSLEKKEVDFKIENFDITKLSDEMKKNIGNEDSPFIKNEDSSISLKEDVFSLENRVYDATKFRIKDNEVSEINKKITEECYESLKRKRKIIIILESPHRDELKKSPYLPAMGKTGSMIKHFLDTFLPIYKWTSGSGISNEIDVVIMNGICYQVSLGKYYKESLNSYIRTKLFLTMWEEADIKNDFITRLKAYLNDGDLVINACTKLEMDDIKNDKAKFNDLLEKEIENLEKIILSHPSGWGMYKYPNE